MKLRYLFCLFAAVTLLSGCPKNERKTKTSGNRTDQPPVPTKDQSGDVTFQGFVGQLKVAIARRDKDMLGSMMPPNFGYRWDDGPPGEDAFVYWDKNNLWPELQALMNERWVPYDGYMVVPPQLAQDSEYRGYRAGVQQMNGSWKFAYFVAAPKDQ
jgi:hypothetical protein